jgi:pilus assembly protein CpaC
MNTLINAFSLIPNRLRWAILVILIQFAPLLTAQAQTAAGPVEVLRLSMGDAQVIDVDFDLADVIVGDNSVATVALLSSRSLVVTPAVAGTTRMLLLDTSGVQRRTLSVIVSESYSQLKAIIDEVMPGAGIQVRNVNGRALVAGVVQDQAEAERALDLARSYSQGDVINALKVVGPRQIMLKVNILELSRSGSKELGINIFRDPQGMEGANGAPFGVIESNINLSVNGQSFSVDVLLRALETKGLAKRLANPTLVAVTGSTASFVVGGEVPIVTSDSEGETVSDYREYGVKLAFTPQVLPNRMIRLTISPEVSEVDWTRRVNDNPAFVSRKVETTIEINSGASFAIAGLLQRDSIRSARQFPWLGDVPILGALFRSSAYQNNQTELVVVVTPILVDERSASNMRGDPTQQTETPSDAETFLLGTIESNEEMTRRFQTGFGVSGPYGHILPAP